MKSEADMHEELLKSFREDCRLRGLAPTTISNTLAALRDFENGRIIDLKAISKDDLKDHLNDIRNRGYKASSVKQRFVRLNAFYKYLQADGLIENNPVQQMQRYLHTYKSESSRRKIISVPEASKLVNSIVDTRNRAIVLLLFKTGIRRQELINIDITDIDFETNSIRLKATPKRSNRTVFFDEEAAEALEMWLKTRSYWYNARMSNALFLTKNGNRIDSNTVQVLVRKSAERIGLHKETGNVEDRFTPHCCRHWFTTHLRKAGMPREFIQELRGDKRRDAIDIYDHIDLHELQESYLAHMPKLL